MNQKAIASKINRSYLILEQLIIDLEEAPEDENLQAHLSKEYDKILHEIEALEDEYLKALPMIALSRSPFSEEIYQLKIDTSGFNAPWWNAEAPVREAVDTLNTFFALTGSAQINEPAPDTAYRIKPGPAVPWVSPRLLDNDEITAVISHIKIGDYHAYPVVYYIKRQNNTIERINTWGADQYAVRDTDEEEGFISCTYDIPEDFDFDLASWIEKGKLFWIAPDDQDMILQTTTDNCPYLNLEGYRYPVSIYKRQINNCFIELEYEDEQEYEIKDSQTNTPHFCSNCGTALKKGARFCSNCGTKI